MTKSTFRGKPSRTHIIWMRGNRGSGSGQKRFDTDYFEKWADHCGFEYQTNERVDHERADRPRAQHRVVFAWGQTKAETIEMDGEEWNLGTQKTPRTFIEIDEEGAARIKGWEFETVVDIQEMKHKGPTLLVATGDGAKKRLNTRKFMSEKRRQQR